MNTPIPVRIPISDAVTLYAIKTQRFKTARLSIYTMTPADEDKSPLGTLLFGILRRGSEKYPRLALINRRLDDLYGTTLTLRNFLRGDNHVLSLTVEMLADAYVLPDDRPHILKETLELLADMLLHPLTDEKGLLREDTVAAEKKSLIDGIRAEINDTRSYAATRLRQIMCEDEPFGLSLSGKIPQIRAATTEDVTDLLRDRLSRARWEVYYVGSEDPERVAETFRSAFDHFKPVPLALSQTKPHVPPARPRRVEETFPVGQGKLCMAWSSGLTDHISEDGDCDDYAAAVVLAELFGIMQSSLLFRHVRETLGLCYYCDAAFEGKKGILSVTSGIHPRHRRGAEEAILSVLSRIQKGQLDPEDLKLAKISLENSYRQLPDSPAAMESYWFWSDDPEKCILPEARLNRLLKITAEDVVRVANRFVLDTVYFLNAERPSEEVDDDEG